MSADRTRITDAVAALSAAYQAGADAFEGSDFRHAAKLALDAVERFLADWDDALAALGPRALTQITDAAILRALGVEITNREPADG